MKAGIKIPMGEHSMVYKHADDAGFSLICSCGWSKSRLYARYVDDRLSRRDLAQDHAQHVRHMALVHDAQTHSDAQCGSSCIYPRVPSEPAVQPPNAPAASGSLGALRGGCGGAQP